MLNMVLNVVLNLVLYSISYGNIQAVREACTVLL